MAVVFVDEFWTNWHFLLVISACTESQKGHRKLWLWCRYFRKWHLGQTLARVSLSLYLAVLSWSSTGTSPMEPGALWLLPQVTLTFLVLCFWYLEIFLCGNLLLCLSAVPSGIPLVVSERYKGSQQRNRRQRKHATPWQMWCWEGRWGPVYLTQCSPE